MKRANVSLAALLFGAVLAASCAAVSLNDEQGSGGAGGDGGGGAAAGADAGADATTDAADDAAPADAAWPDASPSDAAADAMPVDAGDGGQQADAGPNLCGNGKVDPGEQCDGADYDGKTCESLGLGSGTLLCNAFCGVVAKNCKPKELCGDYVDNDQDFLVDCADDECEDAPACKDSCTSPTAITVPNVAFGDTTGRPSVHAAGCNDGSGREIVYSFEAPSDGQVAIHVSSWGGDFAVSLRTACGDGESELACSNDMGPNDFEPEVVEAPVKKGETYFVLIDGVLPQDEGQFDLQIDMAPAFF